MKKILSTMAAVAAVAVNADLLVHYDLDSINASDQVVDSVGANNGAINGTGYSTTTGSSGIIGEALVDSGTNDEYVRSVNAPGISGFSYTMSAWVNTSNNGKATFLSMNDGNWSRYVGLTFSYGKVGMFARNTSEEIFTTNSSDFNDGGWHHVVGIFDGDSSRTLYVDGMLVGTDTSSPAPFFTPTKFSLGALDRSNIVNEYTGMIDDVGLWNESLSAQSVALTHGLGLLSSVALNDSAIGNVLDVYTTQSGSATAGSDTWVYAEGLTGDIGAAGADYIVLGADGSGVALATAVPEPSALVLFAVCGLLFIRRRK